jgi:hypothetical protein
LDAVIATEPSAVVRTVTSASTTKTTFSHSFDIALDDLDLSGNTAAKRVLLSDLPVDGNWTVEVYASVYEKSTRIRLKSDWVEAKTATSTVRVLYSKRSGGKTEAANALDASAWSAGLARSSDAGETYWDILVHTEQVKRLGLLEPPVPPLTLSVTIEGTETHNKPLKPARIASLTSRSSPLFLDVSRYWHSLLP